jgi:hypothetical protein
MAAERFAAPGTDSRGTCPMRAKLTVAEGAGRAGRILAATDPPGETTSFERRGFGVGNSRSRDFLFVAAIGI